MLIYADTNIYSRPFDDKSQFRITLEIEACLIIFEAIKKGEFSCLNSDILKLEIERNNPLKKIYIKPLLRICKYHISQTGKIEKLAENIYKNCNIFPRDFLHIASAITGKAKYFLTCDDALVKKHNCIEKDFSIKIINPIQFVSNFL